MPSKLALEPEQLPVIGGETPSCEDNAPKLEA